MKKFVFEFYSQEGMAGDEAARAESMAAWNKWFGSLGDKIVDSGNPFAPNGMARDKDGVNKIEKWPATGYTIINAASMDEATELSKDCPVLEGKGGLVRIYEALPM